MEWYNKSAEDAIREQNADEKNGLTQSGARHRLERYGQNVWPIQSKSGMAGVIFAQCSDFLVIVALLALLCALVTKQYAAAVLFLIAAAARVVPGVIQDGQAQRAVEALENVTPTGARVLRDGRAETLPTAEIVPGDIVLLEAGDIVPADLRLISTVSMQIDENLITGARSAVFKEADAVLPGPAPVSERVNMAYAGSAVIYGRGRGVVVATGTKTELGHVADALHTVPVSDSAGALRGVGQGFGIFCAIGWILLIILGILRRDSAQNDTLAQMTAYAAAILPSGLAVVTTLTLMQGMERMKKRGAILRRLSTAESLGAANVICADMAGTLTKNELTTTMLWSGGRITTVDGFGYTPEGAMRNADGEKLNPLTRRDLIMTLTAAALCNNAALEETAIDTWSAVGDPTEAALVALAQKAGLKKATLDATFPRMAEIPFDADRRMMTTIHRGGRYPIAYTKGAPDVVLSRCTDIDFGGSVRPLDDKFRRQLLAINRLMSDRALRVLAVAYREFTTPLKESSPEELESELVFLGLVGMLDPARPDTKEAVRRADRAGIRSLMVTGESRETAVALAREIGILGETEEKLVLTGAEIDEMSDGTLRSIVKSAKVYARVTPEHKLRILEALHKNGDIVAMTGDGVSDVPLLRRADIGVAKGTSGTEIARSSSDLIVVDDSYAQIVGAVEEGRAIYENIRKVARLLLSAAAAAALTTLISAIAGLGSPFPILAILLANLVSFSLPAFAIGTQSPERDMMKRPPRAAGCPAVNWSLLISIGVQALIQTLFCVALLFLAEKTLPIGSSLDTYRQTLVFSVLLIGTLLTSFSVRFERAPLWSPGKFADLLSLVISTVIGILVHILCVSAAPLRELLGFSELAALDWVLIFAAAILSVALTEAFKLYVMPALIRVVPGLETGPRIYQTTRERRVRRAQFPRVASADPTQEEEETDISHAAPRHINDDEDITVAAPVTEKPAAPIVTPDTEAAPEPSEAPDMGTVPDAASMQEMREVPEVQKMREVPEAREEHPQAAPHGEYHPQAAPHGEYHPQDTPYGEHQPEPEPQEASEADAPEES
ncbi:MAG: HAD-IC family P-type ATPase [Eubacteriales bacterium]|jgi:Ca2+-transporting ATPase